jgi:hypothetical protein
MVNNQTIKEYVESNPSLVSRKSTSDPALFVLKYKRKVFYDNLWNEYLELCRGTIVDAGYNVVSLPFTKIYNYGIESRAPTIPGHYQVNAYRKVNGFMVAMTWYNGRLLISTTGSIDSDFVGYASELVDQDRERFETYLKHYSGFTFLFECVHRDDPHIIPEQEGLYLLAIRSKQWNSEIIATPDYIDRHADALKLTRVEWMRCSFDDIRELVKTVNHEGFVIYTDDGISTKIKSPYYLTKKLFARCSNTDKLMERNIEGRLDEEYYPLLEYVRSNITEFKALDEQSRLTYIREFINGQT